MKRTSTETIIRGIEDACIKPETSVRGIEQERASPGESSSIDKFLFDADWFL